MRIGIPGILFVCCFTLLAADQPRYSGSGNLLFPDDYREWVFLSSGLGMSYGPLAATSRDDKPAFDNVFVTRTAYQAFRKTGLWPDKTMFVLEIRSSESKGSINQGGHYQSGDVRMEAEVKDKGQWTFFNSEGKAFPKNSSCNACHSANGASDNTFLQFYPTLLPIAREKQTLKEKPIAFTEHTIATGLKGGYQVVVADLNHDGKPDIIALAQGMPDLVWYENPTWERHVLVSNLPHMINCAAGNIDADGIPEIAVAWEFTSNASTSVGKVGMLHHDGDPARPWKLKQIDEIPTSHRLRWADIDGSGKKVVVNAVLTGAQARPPEYSQDRAPLVFYRPGEWKRETISQVNEGVQHGILVTKWQPGDTRDSLLTASFSGIDLYQYAANMWTRTEIVKGDPSPCPKCGSSDVAVGYLGKEKFLAAIEPWHGNQVAIYAQRAAKWDRLTVDDSLSDGHTIVTADLDNDGKDEVIAGFRQGAKSVSIYRSTKDGWQKQVLDEGGMGAASCAAADLNGDRAADIVCIGTPNLKWYENVSRGK